MRNDAFRVDLRLTRGADISFGLARPRDWATVENGEVEEGLPDPVIRRTDPRGRIVGLGLGGDRYAVASMVTDGDVAVASLVNRERSSDLFGARHTVAAPALFGIVLICYRLPPRLSETSLVWLPRGRGRPQSHGTPTWVARGEDELTAWVGDGDRLCLSARQAHFHALLGRGPIDAERSRLLLAWSLHRIHPGGYDAPFMSVAGGSPGHR